MADEDVKIFLQDLDCFLGELQAAIIKLRGQIAKLVGPSVKLECKLLDRMNERIKRLKSASLSLTDPEA